MIWKVAVEVVSKKGEPSGRCMARLAKEPAMSSASRPKTTTRRGMGMWPVCCQEKGGRAGFY